MFSYEEMKQLIESESEQATSWPDGTEEKYYKMGMTYLLAAKAAVAGLKKSLLNKLCELNETKSAVIGCTGFCGANSYDLDCPVHGLRENVNPKDICADPSGLTEVTWTDMERVEHELRADLSIEKENLKAARQTNRELNRRIQALESVKHKQDQFDKWRQAVLKQAAALASHRINETVRVDKLWHDRYYEACNQIIEAGVSNIVDENAEWPVRTYHLDELIRRLITERDVADSRVEILEHDYNKAKRNLELSIMECEALKKEKK